MRALVAAWLVDRLPVEILVQQNARLFPVALNSPLRHRAHACDLGDRETAEELEVDAFAEPGIHSRELFERVVHLRGIEIFLFRDGQLRRQRGDLELTAAL